MEKKISVTTTAKREVVDITEQINGILPGEGGQGLCHLFLLHTTAALTTADLDPGTDLDMLDAFEELIPKLKFRHPHDPSHTPDHILSSLIGTSLSVPVKNGKLVLGTWQRVVLVEFYGPRKREIVVTFTPKTAKA